MDATLISGKRNNRSSSPPRALTRSRSQLFLHRNRSGQLRPDSGPRRRGLYSGLAASCGNGEKREEPSEEDDEILIKDLRKKVKRDGGGRDVSRLLTKDLRARRVYSPQSSSAGASFDLIAVDSDSADRKIAGLGFGSPWSEEKSGVRVDDVVIAVNSDCADREIAEIGFGSSASAEKSGLCVDDATVELTESPDLGISTVAQDFDRANTDSSDEAVKLQDQKLFDEGNGGDCSEKIDDLDEGTVLTTPPDAEIFGDSKVNVDEGKKEEDLRVTDAPFAGQAEENSGEGLSRKDSQRNDSVHKSKSVLGVRPRFQGKLFKAPGSVSYRKLFPFLMDVMGDGSGKPKLGHCEKDEKVMGGHEVQLPLSSQSQVASEPELKSESFTTRETNGSKLTSSQNLLGSPMELDEKAVSVECLSVPSGDDKRFSESKRDPAQCSIHKNDLDYAKVTNDSGCTPEPLGVLNDEFILTTPPEAKIYDNPVVNVDRSKSTTQDMDHLKPMDKRTSTQKNVSEGFCLKADKRKDSLLKRKSVPRPHLHGKLFKTVGSVSYRRFLPFLMELAKDDSGISKFGHGTPKKDEVNMHAKKFKLTLSSQEEASIDRHKVEKVLIHGTVESNALESILFNPANELSDGHLPKVTSSHELPEFPMQLNAKEVVQECLSTPSVEEHIEKVVIGSKDERSSDVSRYPFEGQSLSQLDTDMLDLEGNETDKGAISKSDDAVVLNHVSVSNEVRKSPPKNIISENRDMATHSGNNLKGSNGINGSSADEIENASESRIKLVLNRCPSLKRAGALTYRRLLPLLLNTSEYNSCASVNRLDPTCQKFLDLTPLLPIAGSDFRATSLRDSNDFVPMEHYTANSGTKQQTGLNACELSNDSSSPQSQSPGFQSPNSKCKVMQPESSSDTPISVHRTGSPITPLGPIFNEVITGEKEATLALSESSINSEVKGNSSFLICSDEKEKPPETYGCSQSLSQLEVTEQLEVPAVDFRKGILKRNPRGCRGLCTCLNCASFRLHAERAFEFSRDQLLDAEEVAKDLMKELSHLRDMLGRPNGSVNNNPVFDGDQVKEACRKALAAEQLAKDRLSEMKDDLNHHCRITSLQRPRVRFADHVEEKVIQSRR